MGSPSTRVMMVGTDQNSRGGVSSVINLYQQAGLLDHIDFMSSYRDGSLWTKGLHYGNFLICFTSALLAQPQIRLIHIHSSSYGSFFRKSLVVALSKCLNRKVVLHIHGAEFHLFYKKAPPWLKTYIRTTLCKADSLVALSHEWSTRLKEISNHAYIQVIYNPTVLREPVSTPHSKPVRFLFMGRLGERKGVYDILEVARYLSPMSAHIDLYGDGDELGKIHTIIQKLGLESIVSVHNWVTGETKEQVLKNADVLLLPSYNEGLPISILEAMAYGLPIIASRVGGIPEAVTDGVNGFLIEPGDIQNLAIYMDTLCASADLRLTMGANSYQQAKEKFDMPVIIQQLESLYNTLLEK